MNAFAKSGHSGFSLVELMIAVVIMGVLAGLAMPSYRTWIQNSQIRNAAEAVLNGLQKARAEAVARNTSIALVLGANSSWVVSVVSDGTVIESRSSNEGSRNVTRAVLPVGATTITFSNLGVVTTNADASASLTQVDLDSSSLTAAESQNLRVTVGVNGNAKMCDPNLAAGSSPRAC